MQIIIPMAGFGHRFIREGYRDPKPLIPIDGKPIIEHIIGLFPGNHNFIFICNAEHMEKTNMRQVLTTLKPEAKIVTISPHRLGPVQTILAAKDHIADELATLICYCDVFVEWDFVKFQKTIEEAGYAGCLVCFKGFHPPLSRDGFYATIRTDENNIVQEVREKYSFTPDKMDSWNSAGIHYFKSGATIKKYFQELIDKEMLVNDEYYVSMTHNLLIRDGLLNGIFPVEYFISWGKPHDVREYIYWSNYFKKL